MTTLETLQAVLHPTRRRIVDFLYLYGPSQVGTLASRLEEQVGSISHHLRMLQRVGVVEQVPELATDGRTSWWRLEVTTLSWSVDDFSDDAASRTQALAAERLNIDYQLGKLSLWKRTAAKVDPAWRAAAFSSDMSAQATPAELAQLQRAMADTWQQWKESLDGDSTTPRAPVFVFAHGFPSAP